MNVIQNISIGKRIAVGSSLVLVSAVVLIIAVVISSINSVIREAEKRELQGLFENVKVSIESEARLAQAVDGDPFLLSSK